MKKLMLLVCVVIVTGCQTKLVKPGVSQWQAQRDLAECQYEAEKYGHVNMWGSGVGAGLAEGLRKNKITRQCMELKGYSAQ